MNHDPSLGNGFDGPGTLSGADSSDILMQYIGKKDKTDKEIYEDDLLVHRYPAGESIYRVTIDTNTHDVDGIGFTYYGTHLIFICSSSGYNFGLSTGMNGLADFDELEIIGNIYENPELLEQQ